MQTRHYDPDAPKESTNLSINSDLLRHAKELQINLSQTLEQRLAEMLIDKKRQKWHEENKDAIEAYNRRIEANGAFSDDLRVLGGSNLGEEDLRLLRKAAPEMETSIVRRRKNRGYPAL